MQIGIDLGGTKIEIQALSPRGELLFRQRAPTPQGNYPATVAAIAALIGQAEHHTGHTCPQIGIAIPGAISPASGLIKNANSVCLIGQRLDQDVSALIQRPIVLANDADCFALSEATDGAAAGAMSVFGVILGTGVGGGIVIQGKLLSGPNAICGEWGHNPLPWPDPADPAARPCYCGKQGCIETYLSGPGFAQQFQQQTGTPLMSEQIWQLADLGDPEAAQATGRYIDQLARSLASVINILDPEVIVLGGGLSNVKRLYSEVPQRWERYAFSDSVTTALRRAKYGDSSGVRGAAWLRPAG